MLKSYGNCKERNSLDLTSFLWFRPLCRNVSAFHLHWETSVVSLPKKFWQTFLLLPILMMMCPQHLPLNFKMVVELQGFTLCEWNETRRCQQNCSAAFHHFVLLFFLLGSNVAWDLENCITEKSVIYKLLTQSETVNSTKKAISCQKGTANALPCLQA